MNITPNSGSEGNQSLSPKPPGHLNPVASTLTSDSEKKDSGDSNKVADAAAEAKSKIQDTPVKANQLASDIADKVQESGQKVIEATRGYATNAVNAAGEKVREVQSKYDSAKAIAVDYINEDPVRAVKYAVIATAIFTAAWIGIRRNR